MRSLLLVTAIVISALCLAPGGEESNVIVEIAKWKGNAFGAVTLSFDDGYLATYESVIPLLDERGVKASFNIITERVGKNYGGLELAEWERWEIAAKKAHEIASHTATHPHVNEVSADVLEQELKSSIREIRKNTGSEAISFVYPGGAYDQASKDTVARHFISARTSDDGHNNATPEDMHLLMSKTAAVFTAKDMDGWADEAFEEGLWLIENYHLVADENPTNYSFYLSTDDFKNHLEHLISKDLWIAPQGNVVKYIIERESSNVTILSTSDTNIVLSLTTPLNSSTFDEPLTVMVNMPAHWDSAVATQEENKIDSTFSQGTLYINVIPNRGEVVIGRI